MWLMLISKSKRARVWVVGFMLCLLRAETGAVNTPTGKHYLFTVPFIYQGPSVVILTTMSPNPFDVVFRKLYLRSDEIINATLHLTRGIYEEIEVDSYHKSHLIPTFELRADYVFNVAVFHSDVMKADAYHVLPVAAYGTEYKFYYKLKSTSIVVFSRDDDTTVRMVESDRQQIDELFYEVERTLNLPLAGRAYLFLDIVCNYLPGYMGPHVKYGVTMSGNKPFGLMIAYCGTVDLNDVECLYSSFQKLSADMPLPSNSLGKKYIILKVSGEYNTLLRVIASVARTSLSVNFYRNNIPERVWLVSAGSVYESTNPKDGQTVAVVTSNLPVAVFLYLSDIKCDVNPVYTQLIPTELYYNYYFWNMPHNKKDTILHVYKMCLVLRRFQYRWLLIDGIWQDQEEIFKEWVEQNDWQMYELNSMPGYHVVYTENGAPFGCYFYYHTNVGAGLFAVSSNVGDIHKESCTVTTPTPGDMKDNDCDGAIDEESAASSCFYLDASADTCKNGVKFDDDFDGKSDEDLARPAPVAGGWSGWSKWTCLAECGVSQYTVRRRLCNSPAPKNDGYPCLGGDEELEETYCNSGKTCANACPRGRFGLDCAGDCSNCEVECVKDSGYCPVCKEGWTGPACQTPCPEMTFGYNCKYSCSKKCGGRDCTERKYGICKPSVSVVGLIAFWFIAILGPLIGLPLWFGYKSFSKNSGNRITDLMFE